MPYFGARVIPSDDSRSRGLGCAFDPGGRPNFQAIWVPDRPPGFLWQVQKIGTVLRFNKEQTSRLALYEDSGSQSLNSTCNLLAEGEVDGFGSTPYEYAELEVDVSIILPDANIFWIGIKSADDSGGGQWDSVNYFNSLRGTSTLGVYRIADCQSWAAGSIPWPDPLGIDTELNLDGYSLHVWIYCQEVPIIPMSGAIFFPVHQATGQLTAGLENRSFSQFPLPVLDAEATAPYIVSSPSSAGSVKYQAVLSASGLDDYTIPLTSFSMRLRQSPLSCYLSAVVPSILSYADEINARIDGELEIFWVDDNESTSLIKANVQELRLDLGPTNRSGAIYCTNLQTYSTPQILNVTPLFYSTSDGTQRYRLPVFPTFPEDVLYIDGEFLVVENVAMYVSNQRSLLEVEVRNG